MRRYDVWLEDFMDDSHISCMVFEGTTIIVNIGSISLESENCLKLENKEINESVFHATQAME